MKFYIWHPLRSKPQYTGKESHWKYTNIGMYFRTPVVFPKFQGPPDRVESRPNGNPEAAAAILVDWYRYYVEFVDETIAIRENTFYPQNAETECPGLFPPETAPRAKEWYERFFQALRIGIDSYGFAQPSEFHFDIERPFKEQAPHPVLANAAKNGIFPDLKEQLINEGYSFEQGAFNQPVASESHKTLIHYMDRYVSRMVSDCVYQPLRKIYGHNIVSSNYDDLIPFDLFAKPNLVHYTKNRSVEQMLSEDTASIITYKPQSMWLHHESDSRAVPDEVLEQTIPIAAERGLQSIILFGGNKVFDWTPQIEKINIWLEKATNTGR